MKKETVYVPVKVEGASGNYIPDKSVLIVKEQNEMDKDWDALVKLQEGYFFTEEQLNELLSNVIKDTLETASEKALVYQKCDNYHTGENVWEDKSDEVYITVTNDYSYDEHHSISIDKQSIIDTFEQTYLKHKI